MEMHRSSESAMSSCTASIPPFLLLLLLYFPSLFTALAHREREYVNHQLWSEDWDLGIAHFWRES